MNSGAATAESGRLTFLESEFDDDPPEQQGLGGATALAFVVGPERDHLYVASEVDHAVVVFQALTAIFADGFESGDISEWK